MKSPINFSKYRSINLEDRRIKDTEVKKSLSIVKKWAESFNGFYPKIEDRWKQETWHCNIPILDSLINEKSLDMKIKKECIQHIFDAVYHLVTTKKRNGEKEWSKIGCFVSTPNTFMSSVDIFFNEKYYKNFFIRNNSHHRWIQIDDPNRSLIKELGIIFPVKTNFKESGYTEIIIDQDYQYRGEVWFIGEK